MFAGAAFTDSADIKATEAVDMLTALGVIDGFEDGSFQPNGTVTRAQMAKMIYVARTGNSNADSYASTPTTFTDITATGLLATSSTARLTASLLVSPLPSSARTTT